MPKISVIIPVYNTEKYIKKCLDSVINQTLNDIEIICVNDCSSDNSLLILKEYAKKDDRVKLIDLPQNQGAGDAKNAGLKIAQGEYIGFVDSDDYIDLNYYEELYKKAKENDADIVKSKLLILEIDGTKKISNLNSLIKEKSKLYFSFEYTSAIYKSSLIFDNNITFLPNLIVGEDVVFQHKATIKSKIFKVIDNVNYYYVRRENSLNAHEYDSERIDSAIKTIEYMAENFNDALYNEIDEKTYLDWYIYNDSVLLDYTITITKQIESKIKCVEKFIEIFYKTKLPAELEKLYSERDSEIFDYIKNNNVEKLLEICLKYKRLANYCTLKQMRKNVKKEFEQCRN